MTHDEALPHARSRPVVWSIAGSDSGAGAGIQADLRAFDAFDLHGCTAIAAITAQNSLRVERVDAVAVDLLDAQLAALASDLPPRAIKTGMLGSAANVRCVAGWVDTLRRDRPVALVIDPVWRATTGADLSSNALREVLLSELLPRATVITPNRAEAAWLLGWDAQALTSHAGVERAAAALRRLGVQGVVITGGDASGAADRSQSLDWIDTPQAQGWLALPRVATPHHHGSGCVFAASLAAALALDFCSADACVLAKMSSTQALRQAFGAGQGAGAVRPRRGFGVQADLIPTLRGPTRPDREADADATPTARGFASLTQPRIGLYAVVDSADWVERVLAAGVRTVQLRIKASAQLPAEQLCAEIVRSVRAARAVQAQLFINDHWQLAIAHGAYGVHLGQEDLVNVDMAALRRAGLRVGLSTHAFWEVARAHAWAPSYIACGPIHATTTKDMPWRPQGPANLAYWCQVLREPVVAIAGMDGERSLEAMRCGAAGVAVLRGITASPDTHRVVQQLQDAIAAAYLAAPLAAPELPRTTFVETTRLGAVR